jgi:putative glutamine amidotransferase
MKPVVGVTSDSVLIRGFVPGFGVYVYYIEAVIGGAGALPWIIPASGDALDRDALLDRLDGMVLTGAVSNIEPHRYHGPPSYPGCPHDPARDDTTLPLTPMILERGMPLLAICRGLQELNVALGGTLHQEVHRIAGFVDHRADDDTSLPEKFAPAHAIEVRSGGVLARLVGDRTFRVNSVHGQGIDRLAPGLRIEAVAPDGLIEAVSVEGAKGFNLAVQWHPEWDYAGHPLHRAIWAAFAEACAAYARAR